MIYLDNAATTKVKPPQVIEACVYAMTHMGNAGRGLGEVSLDTQRMIFNTRKNIGKLIGSKSPSEIAFTQNATASLNCAIKSIIKKEDHVITTRLEHNSVLRPLYQVYDFEEETIKKQISFIGSRETTSKGSYVLVDIEAIKKSINKNTKAIICTHGSNVTGDVLDLESIGKIAKEHNLVFIVDASQTMGHISIDVEKMNIDILCFTGHKGLMGPQGTGGIYVKEGIAINSLFMGGTGYDTFAKEHPKKMPEVLEAGTLNSHGICGLNAGIEFINSTGMNIIHKKEIDLVNKLYEGLKLISGVEVYGNFTEKERCGIVSINVKDFQSSKVSQVLEEEYGIVTRASGHCAPLVHEVLGTREQGMVRFSISYYNTEEEIDFTIKAVSEIVTQN